MRRRGVLELMVSGGTASLLARALAVQATAFAQTGDPTVLAAAVETAFDRAIQRNWLPGGVALVRHAGQRILLQAFGDSLKYDSATSLSAEPIAASSDTLYDLASI